jgi:hypothetical protein
MATCKRCDKDHATRDCKTPWRKSRPGRAKTLIELRMPDGSWMRIERDLTDGQAKRLAALMVEP